MKEEFILVRSDEDLWKAAEKEGIKIVDLEEDALGKISEFVT